MHYALRLRRWWVAGLCGMAAALTRQIGLLLVVPFLVEYLETRQERESTLRRALPLMAGALIPAGILVFIAYQQIALGDGLLFVRAQQAWGRTLTVPWQGIVVTVRHIIRLNAPLPAHTIAALRTIRSSIFRSCCCRSCW